MPKDLKAIAINEIHHDSYAIVRNLNVEDFGYRQLEFVGGHLSLDFFYTDPRSRLEHTILALCNLAA